MRSKRKPEGDSAVWLLSGHGIGILLRVCLIMLIIAIAALAIIGFATLTWRYLGF